MADHQKGYGVPIGGVIAHETLVSPSGVGYDIDCGNKAVLTDALHRRFRASVVSFAERWLEMSVIKASRTLRLRCHSTRPFTARAA